MLDILTLTAIGLLVFIEWQRQRTERTRVDTHLIAQRFEAYESVRRTLTRVCADGRPTAGDLRKLDRQAREARWLFEPVLADALENIAHDAAVLDRKRRSRTGMAKRKARARLDVEIDERVARLRAELDSLPDRFAPPFNRRRRRSVRVRRSGMRPPRP